ARRSRPPRSAGHRPSPCPCGPPHRQPTVPTIRSPLIPPRGGTDGRALDELVSHLIRLLGPRPVALPLLVLAVTLLVFVVMSYSPADPASLALGESASPQALEHSREPNGLNDPLWLRSFTFLGGLVQGDLGTSSGNVPVLDMVVG